MVDTESPEFESWNLMYRSYDVELNREIWTNAIGRGRGYFDVYQHLSDLTGHSIDKNTIQTERQLCYEKLVKPQPLLPGVRTFLDEADKLNVQLAIASSSTHQWIEDHLEPRGVLSRFSVISTADEAKNKKPDPEIYLNAIQRLRIHPENAIAIEDSVNGLTAAKKAGIFCIAVPNLMTQEMDFSQADVRVKSLADVSLTEMIEAASVKNGKNWGLPDRPDA